jgi:hypothetical protein
MLWWQLQRCFGYTRFYFRRVTGCVEGWCPILPGHWHCVGAGADRIKVVELGSGFLYIYISLPERNRTNEENLM